LKDSLRAKRVRATDNPGPREMETGRKGALPVGRSINLDPPLGKKILRSKRIHAKECGRVDKNLGGKKFQRGGDQMGKGGWKEKKAAERDVRRIRGRRRES